MRVSVRINVSICVRISVRVWNYKTGYSTLQIAYSSN